MNRASEINRVFSRESGRVAVQDREQVLRFVDVDRRSEKIGSVLLRLAAKHLGLVTLHVPKSVDEYVLTLTLMRIELPGLTIAPDVSERQIQTIRQLYPVRLHVAHRDFAALYSGCQELGRIDNLIVFAGNIESNLPALPENCAWTLMTSGSTGSPKLVMLDEANLIERAFGESRDFGLREGEVIACFLNSSHDLGLNQILSAFFSGAILVMHKLIFMIDFVRLLAEHEVAGFTAVPSFWRLMMSARVLPLELPKLRYVTVSGGSLEPAAWRWLRHALPHVDIIKTYGQTETFRSLLRHHLPAEGDEPFDSLGFPIQGVDLSLKESGELVHRGVGTMLGYYGAELISLDRGIETGDIFLLEPSHGYSFQGRRDDMMKINGHRVYPSQLERVLMEHPAVVEAMVSVVGAEVGVDRLVAVVAVVDGSSVSTVTLQGFVAERVPRGLVPSDVLIRDRLPKTSSGKIDRVQIAQEIQSFLFKKTNV